MTNGIRQSLVLDLFRINVYATFIKIFHTGSRSSQYQCACNISSKYSTRFKSWDLIFFFFFFFFFFFSFKVWTSAKPRLIKNCILYSPGVDIVNINVYAKFHYNIPFSSREEFGHLGPTTTSSPSHFGP